MFDPQTVDVKHTSGSHFLMFLLDYNEDREYSSLVTRKSEKGKEPMKMSEMEKNKAENNEAMIYIHTLSNFLILRGGIKNKHLLTPKISQ